MNIKSLYTGLAFITFCYMICTPVEAAYTIKNGRLVNADYMATLPPEQHYELGLKAMDCNDWREASRQFSIISTCFPNSQLGQESFYYLGVAEFNLDELDFSNDAFSQYLKRQNNPQHFLSAIEYKYCIAEKLRSGARRRFLGTKQLPKWASGRTLALKIYDEVIAAMPSSEMAAKALYSKAYLLWDIGEYRDSIEAFQLICKRFPKSELAPDCYVIMSYIYIDLCKSEPQNPDVLSFADLNARKFKIEFPKEERLCEVDRNVQTIKELYANFLYETGQFYERVNQPRASIIYYYSAISRFPDTEIARRCISRLYVLDPTFCEEDLNLHKNDQDSNKEDQIS